MPAAERTTPRVHISELLDVLPTLDIELLGNWGRHLSNVLQAGNRLLVAGNGGSAAQASHLAAELVGRFKYERRPLPAISLASDPAVLSALGNDFGIDEIFSRQVQAQGRPGDILLLLSTSGSSQNLVRAGVQARQLGMLTWVITGPSPNKIQQLADEAFCVDSRSAQSVQECHLVVVHALCAAIDEALAGREDRSPGHRVQSQPAVRLEVDHRMAGRPRPHRHPPKGPLVIVGDAFLDQDIKGSAHRLSPEAPVPVVDSAMTLERPGGAALAAVLAARRPDDVVLVTCLGDDSGADRLRAMVRTAGVRLVDLATSGPTMIKTRVRAADRTLLRYDTGPASSPPLALTSEGLDALESAAAILVADYGRGMSADQQIRAALAATTARVPVTWDPHPRGMPPVPGTCLVCPSAEDAGKLVPNTMGSGLVADVTRARELCRAWAVPHVCITRGAAGAVLVDADGLPKVVPASRVPVVDTCGAGDQFAVAAAYWLGCGVPPSAAVNAAVGAATDFLGSGGVSSWRPEQEHRVADDSGAAVEIASQVRDAGGTVVVAGGCFDLLHAGHIALLERARSLGDCLIVCLNSDMSVRRIKGPARPVVSAADRALILEALEAVDAVVTFEEETPTRILAQLRPHLYVKGGDYENADISEREVVEAVGGEIVLLPYLDGYSTTGLVENVVRQHAQPALHPGVVAMKMPAGALTSVRMPRRSGPVGPVVPETAGENDGGSV